MDQVKSNVVANGVGDLETAGKFLFEDVNGLPIPRLPNIDGAPDRPDGQTYFDLAGAVKHFGCSGIVLSDLARAAWPVSRNPNPFTDPIPPAVAADPKARAALESCIHAHDMELKRLRYPDLSQEHFGEFLEVCRRRELDPWCNQIYAGTRANPRTQMPELAIIIGIEGARLIAHRTGEHGGRDRTVYLYDDDKQLIGAETTVYRGFGERRAAFTVPVFMEEYYPGEGVDELWDQMPRMNLGRVSEMASLRAAHAQDLGRFYTPEEMAQARARMRGTRSGRPRLGGLATVQGGDDGGGYSFDASTSQV